jgi:prepilin-type N-terminal cleavage/methylation domain-containing protein
MGLRTGSGITLIELLVVLAIMGLMAGVVGLAARAEGSTEATDDRESLALLRRRAVESGRATQALLRIDGRSVPALALPDGRVLGAEEFNVNPLIGTKDATDSR